MPDWKALAQARGVPATDALAARLTELEETFAPIRARLEWTEEPPIVFLPDMDEERPQ
jgi:hypothetical protein